ncbi:hypothetical protein [Streptomyces massasporeus]|uniref:hypothetical protein n=1 Tax=Streptomyces massasporeus TaxID=67324 RepID=UPI0033D3A2B6
MFTRPTTGQEQGFRSLTSHDALGRARMQILDGDWRVKLKESCPAEDQAEPSAVGGTAPNFAGKSVKAARHALDSSTSITVTDASGDARFILVECNWQACNQTPKAGRKLKGQPVEFGAVKFGEKCP